MPIALQADRAKETSKLLVLGNKFFITFIFVPLALWFNVHVFLDITFNGSRWDFFGDTFFQVRVGPLADMHRLLRAG